MMRREITTYAAVFAALLVLLATTVLAAQAGVWISLLIAATKIALIAVFFMKLRREDSLGWAFALAGVVLGAVGMVLLLADVLTR